MEREFSGIERRLEKLLECLTKLEPLKIRSFDDFEHKRSNWRFIGGGVGVHWPDLDEPSVS